MSESDEGVHGVWGVSGVPSNSRLFLRDLAGVRSIRSLRYFSSHRRICGNQNQSTDKYNDINHEMKIPEHNADLYIVQTTIHAKHAA